MTDRSWNVPLKVAPVEENVDPTEAVSSAPSSVSSLNLSSAARSPDHSRWALRSVMTSNTPSGDAPEWTDVCVTNRKGR